MKFQVLSHAGLQVTAREKSLICDPWLIGSCYWRSWWNYPAVSKQLLQTLSPDFIYLTHIHWDHFQGPSLSSYNDIENPIQIHTSAFLLKQCIGLLLFSHLPISKRVVYRATSTKVKYIKRLNFLFNFYECDMLPWYRMFSWRNIENWCLRWREIILYFQLIFDKIIYKKIDFSKYLQENKIAVSNELP